MMQSHLQSPTPVADFDLNLTRTLVPLKDMSESHLLALLQDARIEVVCAGQTLFTAGHYDGQHIYLLYGDVILQGDNGATRIVKGRASLMPIGHHQPRQYTAMATSDCCVLRIDSERLDQLLTWSEVADYLQLNIARERDLDEDVDWMMTVLKSNLFFKVPPLNVEAIFARLEPQVVYAGDTIIRQGEVGEHCYFIKEGRAEVSRYQGGQHQFLAEVGVGRCLGEDALVNDAPRNASVRMLTDGVLMRLAKQDFYRLLKAPAVAQVPLAALSAELEQGAVLVDVRSDEEYSAQHLEGAVNIPLSLLAIKSRLLRPGIRYLCYCDSGRRSQAAAHLLARQGYEVQALADCVELFRQASWQALLVDRGNSVLREGRAVKGE